MTEEQAKAYSTRCEIEYSQEYLKRRDMTIIFEDTYLVSGPGKVMVRERICGLYHGEPDDDAFRQYYTSGVEAVMDDELMAALSKNEVEHVEPKFTYSVVVYGGFDEEPLIRYQADYDDKDLAVEIYHNLEDTFRRMHKIFDINQEEFISQSDCAAMAVIKSGAFDNDSVVYFRSLVDNTNYEDYTEDFNLIVKYFQEHNMMA